MKGGVKGKVLKWKSEGGGTVKLKNQKKNLKFEKKSKNFKKKKEKRKKKVKMEKIQKYKKLWVKWCVKNKKNEKIKNKFGVKNPHLQKSMHESEKFESKKKKLTIKILKIK